MYDVITVSRGPRKVMKILDFKHIHCHRLSSSTTIATSFEESRISNTDYQVGKNGCHQSFDIKSYCKGIHNERFSEHFLDRILKYSSYGLKSSPRATSFKTVVLIPSALCLVRDSCTTIIT